MAPLASDSESSRTPRRRRTRELTPRPAAERLRSPTASTRRSSAASSRPPADAAARAAMSRPRAARAVRGPGHPRGAREARCEPPPARRRSPGDRASRAGRCRARPRLRAGSRVPAPAGRGRRPHGRGPRSSRCGSRARLPQRRAPPVQRRRATRLISIGSSGPLAALPRPVCGAEVGQPGLQPRQLHLERLRVAAPRRLPAQQLARQEEHCHRPAELVLGSRDRLEPRSQREHQGHRGDRHAPPRQRPREAHLVCGTNSE